MFGTATVFSSRRRQGLHEVDAVAVTSGGSHPIRQSARTPVPWTQLVLGDEYGKVVVGRRAIAQSWPMPLNPQQRAVPSADRAHVCSHPAVSWTTLTSVLSRTCS